MGHLELNPTDNVASTRVPRSLSGEANGTRTPSIQHPSRINGRSRDNLQGVEDLTLARIAQRFAPHQSFVSIEDQRFDNHPLTSILSSSRGLRTLIAVLILVALFPSLTFGAMFGLGVIKTPWSTTAVLPERNDSVRLAVQASSVAIMPVPERVQSKQIAEDRALTLTTPATLEARAGEDIPFSIALDHTDELPARAIVAVSGLPQGTTLSSGRPYGEMEWNLRSDEIGDLRLALPNTASGETNLRIKLVTPGGEIIAGSETVLKVTAALGVTGLEERLANQDAETATSGGSVPSQPNTNVQTDDAHAKWIKPSAFVNLREGPSSSAAVISVVAKDTKLSVLGRKRGWVQVTNPETSESGWIYAENLATVTKSQRGTKQAADLDSPPASNYLWPSLSQWLTSP